MPASPQDLIERPGGGGAQKGLGEKFSPDLFTGTGNFSVPIALPPGRNGHEPRLALSYSTGRGNSPFGLGWALGAPGITRKTSKGVPRYDDSVDVFILSGEEDLVPVGGDARTTRYRPRTEGAFARISHVHDAAIGDDYWEVRSRDGSVNIYGTPRPQDAAPGWRDPATVTDPERPQRRSAWRLTETRDAFGNRVQFVYERDANAAEGPHRWDQVYLSEVRYVDHGDPAQPSFLIVVKLRYGDRPDPFSEHRSGFEVRTIRRCRTIEVWTNAGTSRLARAYHLAYLDELGAGAGEPPANRASLLAEIRVVGHDDEHGKTQSLPPLRMSYGSFANDRRRLVAVTGPELPSAALGAGTRELVDLTGSGLPDLLEIDDRVRYWRNLGDGKFDHPREMRAAPAGHRLVDGGVQLIDADGDGRIDLLVTKDGLNGYFPLSRDGEWDRSSFRTCEKAPSFNLEDPEVRLVDLDGDGVTDALRSGTSFECFFNDPRRGWHETRLVERRRLDAFPDVSFSDPRVKWADMTGDGLTDIVLVHDGRVEYWPSLGRGEFASRITMRGAPRFPDGYDPRRVLLGDVDGDGLADLLYVDDGRVTLWINQGGSTWAEGIEIRGTPTMTSADTVRLVDLFGTGVAGVLWSRDAGSDRGASMYFLDFVGGHKPYLLERIDNGAGSVTHVEYAPSTELSRRSRAAGRPWLTTLPFPVQVVTRITAVDLISGGRLSSEYTYHHGYWDGVEREFRGFGRVDQRDISVAGHDDVPAASPVETRTWYHLGAVTQGSGSWAELDYTSELWEGDPVLSRPPSIPGGLDPSMRALDRDALRAIRGRVLRSEVYGLDGSTRADRPFTVTESVHDVSVVVAAVPEARRPAVVFPVQTAERTTQWERGVEPLTRINFSGDHDTYGQPRRKLALAVPRGRDYRGASTAATTPFLAVLEVLGRAHRDEASLYLVDRVAHSTMHEILDDGRSTLAGPLSSAWEVWGLALAGTAKSRVLAQTLSYYDGESFAGLPRGELGSSGALTRSESLVLTEALIASTYPQVPPYLTSPGDAPAWTDEYPAAFRSATPALGGYVVHAPDEICAGGYYSAVEQRSVSSRGLLLAQRDPLGGITTIEYDAFDLLPVRISDAAGLSTVAEHDYRAMRPRLVSNPNGNRTAYSFTPLGLVASIAVLGKPALAQGDAEGTPSTVYTYALDSFIERGQPIYVHTTRRVHHSNEVDASTLDPDAIIEHRELSDGFGRLLQTRTLAEDVLFGSTSFGAGVLPTDQAQIGAVIGTARGPESPPNVVVSGWQTRDAKGRVVERYEPFLSTGWDYAAPSDAERGQKATIFYDAPGRVVKTVNPDGSEQLTVFGEPATLAAPDDFEPSPWVSYVYDANDNAGRTLAADPGAAAYGTHWNTPTSAVVDALGRTVEQVARSGPDPSTDWHTIRHELDIRGNLVKVWDQLGRPAFQYGYDLAQRRIREEHLDAGTSFTVFGGAGDVIEHRDARGAVVLHARDLLRRPTHLWARDRAGEGVTLRERVVYGDAPEPGSPGAADARAKNLLGKIFQHHDEAGLLTFSEYDFKGNVLEKSRRVISDKALLKAFSSPANWKIETFRVDWQPPQGTSLDVHAVGLLEAVGYVVSQRYDALNRLKHADHPGDMAGNRRRLTPTYNRAGALERVVLDGTVFVHHIAYNAKGQRTLIAYGDPDPGKPGPRLMTRHAYDPETFRLVRLRTEGFTLQDAHSFVPSGALLQDIAYEYDLAGNSRAIHDRAPGSGPPAQPDRLDRQFDYDALYRLIMATGREGDVALPTPWDATPKGMDATKTRLYTERYGYDDAGNLDRIEHRLSGAPGLPLATRTMQLVAGTNRLATVTVGATVYSYEHDAAGNLIRENTERHFEWDHASRMRAFQVQTGNVGPSQHAHYLYDAGGHRVKKLLRTQGGRVEVTIYIDGVFEHNRIVDAGTTQENDTLHVLDGERRIATVRAGQAFVGDATPAVKFHLADHLHSSVLVVAVDGGWINREEYTPWGETSFGSFARKRYRFTGMERDEESGFAYHGARYYAPWLGRWASCDPAGMVDGLNLYSYVKGDPIKHTDPSGQSAQDNYAAGKTVETLQRSAVADWASKDGYVNVPNRQRAVEATDGGAFKVPRASGNGTKITIPDCMPTCTVTGATILDEHTTATHVPRKLRAPQLRERGFTLNNPAARHGLIKAQTVAGGAPTYGVNGELMRLTTTGQSTSMEASMAGARAGVLVDRWRNPALHGAAVATGPAIPSAWSGFVSSLKGALTGPMLMGSVALVIIDMIAFEKTGIMHGVVFDADRAMKAGILHEGSPVKQGEVRGTWRQGAFLPDSI